MKKKIVDFFYFWKSSTKQKIKEECSLFTSKNLSIDTEDDTDFKIISPEDNIWLFDLVIKNNRTSIKYFVENSNIHNMEFESVEDAIEYYFMK